MTQAKEYFYNVDTERLIGATVSKEVHVYDLDSDFDEVHIVTLFKKFFWSKDAANRFYESLDVYSELPDYEPVPSTYAHFLQYS